MTLEPFEYFTIVRQLADPADSNTYYVRAVVRNARTDAIIDTVNLTDRGSQRFSREWQVPADTSGLGFYIIITSTIYTDSGYSSVSDTYGYEASEYLIQERKPHFGGHGASIDYDKIRKMVREIVSEEVGGIPKPEEPKETDFSGILEAIGEVKTAIKTLPPPEKIDLAPVLERMQMAEGQLIARIEQLPPPVKPEKVDLSPAHRGLQKIADIVATTRDVEGAKEEILMAIGEAVEKEAIFAMVADAVKGAVQNIGALKPNISFQQEKTPEPKEDERLTRARRLVSV